LGWIGLWRGGEAVVVVSVQGVDEGFAPPGFAAGTNVFVLGEMEGLEHGLGEIGKGACGAGFYIALSHGDEDAAKSGVEVVGGEIVRGEEIGEVVGERFGGAGAGLFLGVIEAEVRMAGDARCAATAAVCERELTQGRTVLWTKTGHD
jgi:hypothetical protein